MDVSRIFFRVAWSDSREGRELISAILRRHCVFKRNGGNLPYCQTTTGFPSWNYRKTVDGSSKTTTQNLYLCLEFFCKRMIGVPIFQLRNISCRHLKQNKLGDWADFKWLSKVITWLRLLRLVIGLNDSRLVFNQREAKPKPKPIAPCTRDFSSASSELQVTARNCDWFIALPFPVVIGRSNRFGFGFSIVIWKPL